MSKSIKSMKALHSLKNYLILELSTSNHKSKITKFINIKKEMQSL